MPKTPNPPGRAVTGLSACSITAHHAEDRSILGFKTGTLCWRFPRNGGRSECLIDLTVHLHAYGNFDPTMGGEIQPFFREL